MQDRDHRHASSIVQEDNKEISKSKSENYSTSMGKATISLNLPANGVSCAENIILQSEPYL